jgi:hypothetical protein
MEEPMLKIIIIAAALVTPALTMASNTAPGNKPWVTTAMPGSDHQRVDLRSPYSGSTLKKLPGKRTLPTITLPRPRPAVLNEEPRNAADKKAWTEAVTLPRPRPAALNEKPRNTADKKARTEAITLPSPRPAVLNKKPRNSADEKAWTEAVSAGTSTAFAAYIQNFSSGAHVADARRRLVALDAPARNEVPTVDIEKTCRAAAAAMVSLMGGSTTGQDMKGCLDSEQRAREQIVKDRATYSSADKGRCMRTDVYLPSYVEWLTCLEMEREVRMQRDQLPATSSTRLPTVRPAINR